MNLNKKLISLILTLTMLISLSVSASAETESATQPEDSGVDTAQTIGGLDIYADLNPIPFEITLSWDNSYNGTVDTPNDKIGLSFNDLLKLPYSMTTGSYKAKLKVTNNSITPVAVKNISFQSDDYWTIVSGGEIGLRYAYNQNQSKRNNLAVLYDNGIAITNNMPCLLDDGSFAESWYNMAIPYVFSDVINGRTWIDDGLKFSSSGDSKIYNFKFYTSLQIKPVDNIRLGSFSVDVDYA